MKKGETVKQTRGGILIAKICINVFVGYLLLMAGVAQAGEQWVMRAVSVQGNVQFRKAGETAWKPVSLNTTYSAGVVIRVLEKSRAAFRLPNQAILRVDEKTTITFMGLEKEGGSLIDLFRGAVHFFSRIPRVLKVSTPFSPPSQGRL